MRVSRAEWSTDEARWTVHATRNETGDAVTMTCGYLFMCAGYYSYTSGFTPEFAGMESFTGQVIHPQAVAREP